MSINMYSSRFNNNSLYPQVCLTLSRFKYCTNTKPTDYNSVFELLVFTNNVSGKLNCRTAKYLLDYLQSMDESWSIITCFWKSHDSDPSINILYMLIEERSTYICWSTYWSLDQHIYVDLRIYGSGYPLGREKTVIHCEIRLRAMRNPILIIMFQILFY